MTKSIVSLFYLYGNPNRTGNVVEFCNKPTKTSNQMPGRYVNLIGNLKNKFFKNKRCKLPAERFETNKNRFVSNEKSICRYRSAAPVNPRQTLKLEIYRVKALDRDALR